jgi:hypothetical protein
MPAGPAAPIDWSAVVWHPILSALETRPGHWLMLDGFDRPHALIEFVRRGPDVGYKAVTWAPDAADRQLIGYYLTLRAATKSAHLRYVASLGNPGPPIANWGQGRN